MKRKCCFALCSNECCWNCCCFGCVFRAHLSHWNVQYRFGEAEIRSVRVCYPVKVKCLLGCKNFKRFSLSCYTLACIYLVFIYVYLTLYRKKFLLCFTHSHLHSLVVLLRCCCCFCLDKLQSFCFSFTHAYTQIHTLYINEKIDQVTVGFYIFLT